MATTSPSTGAPGKKEALFELIEIPERFGPIEMVVDDHKIKTFAFTQDDYGAWYFGSSPFGGKRIGHASILTNDLLQLFTLVYDPNTVVGLHTQEEIWFHNPVLLDETVTLQGQYVDKYERRGKGYVVMEAEARGADGRVLVRHRGVEIMRVQPGAVAGSATAERPDKPVTGEYRRDLPVATTAAGGLEVGTPIAPLEKRITQEQISVFSRCGMYVKSIHTDLDVARRGGLRLPIVQGQQEFCYLAELLTGFFGASWFCSGWLKAKFLRTVEAGETIVARGVISEPMTDAGRLGVEVWIENQAGQMTTVGWASASVATGS